MNTMRLTGPQIAAACSEYVQKRKGVPDGVEVGIDLRYEPLAPDDSAFIAAVTWGEAETRFDAKSGDQRRAQSAEEQESEAKAIAAELKAKSDAVIAALLSGKMKVSG